MKMLFLVYDAVYDDEVSEALDKSHPRGYTKWVRVLGRGQRTDPRMDTAVWPGFNNAVVMAVNDGQEAEVKDALAGALPMDQGGFRLFAWDLEQLL